ncbi:MAG: hypothetical protein PHO63_04395 [Bacilli bacterium]|nr:hypothetical protein [Bacilli bacterium]MDD4809306.1 hypothetical protein [Bacilli bacterium]
MFFRIMAFLTGFGLTVIGCIYIISYLNLMTLGYNFGEYVKFISRQIECLYALIGIIILCLSIFIPGGNNDELYIRYFN